MDQVNINVFVGNLATEKELYNNYGGEDYYLTHLHSYGADIPVVMSQYFYDKYAGHRVLLKAYVKRARKRIKGTKKCQIFSYLNAVHVEETDDEQDIRFVEIEGIVSTEPSLRLVEGVVSCMQFEMGCQIPFSKPFVVSVPCRAFERVARKLVDVKRGEYIHASGYVSGCGITTRVIVKQVQREEKTHEVS